VLLSGGETAGSFPQEFFANIMPVFACLAKTPFIDSTPPWVNKTQMGTI
jgi:hypothetical protein